MPTRGLGDTLTNCCGPVVYREGGHPRSPSYFSFTARRGARETSQSRALRDDSPVILVSPLVAALAKRANPGRCATIPQLLFLCGETGPAIFFLCGETSGSKKKTKGVTPFNSWIITTQGLGYVLTNFCGPVVYGEGGHPRGPRGTFESKGP